jgi:hypothetical protein
MLSSLLRSVGIDYSSNEHVIILAEVFLALQFHNIYGQVRWNKGQYFVLAVILIHEPLSRSVDKVNVVLLLYGEVVCFASIGLHDHTRMQVSHFFLRLNEPPKLTTLDSLCNCVIQLRCRFWTG